MLLPPCLTAFVLVALTASLFAAGTAVAGTVGIDGDTLRYDAAPGEFNQLAIMLQSGRFTIQDGYSQTRDTLFVTALAPCVRDTTPQPDPGMTDAYCPPRVTRIAYGLATKATKRQSAASPPRTTRQRSTEGTGPTGSLAARRRTMCTAEPAATR